jgi:class 3 adenylate cyclase
MYSLSMYKTDEYADKGKANKTPIIVAVFVTVASCIMAATFYMYDRYVTKRNDKIVSAASRSNAIIASLFPTQVRERLFAAKDEYAAPNTKLKKLLKSDNLLNDGNEKEDDCNFMYKTKPIADLFPETTILFADIVGFTAWSSVREPTQVFVLLETLYCAFDQIAKKHRVFKVETIGDCYVAVTGLPDPLKDHAIAMARFSHECMLRMQVLVKKLEIVLGPDTSDLSMRMGIHSGPVTAGVLRGERSRFQLFGDAMNTAARMEHTGSRDRIQMSQETADLIVAAGKATWITPREDGKCSSGTMHCTENQILKTYFPFPFAVVEAKGKGVMQTYWLEIVPKVGQVSAEQRDSSGDSDVETGQNLLDVTSTLQHTTPFALEEKSCRLVNWNVDVLLRLIKQIVVRRESGPLLPEQKGIIQEEQYKSIQTSGPLQEVKEIISLPGFVEANYQDDPEDILLPNEVVIQLHDYITHIAGLYRNNPFHNFEHASHVTMSVVKLLSRIVAPQQLEDDSESYHDAMGIASTLHDHTYGITSDPLTQFSCVLSALIHDVDHPGVPNAQLVKEGHELASQYNRKSPAEQHSVDLAWNLLMEDRYQELRDAIYQTDAELVRFRQLVVNSVMATDIADSELKALRNLRWDRAFSSATVDVDHRDTISRKATIVIEHLIQASDVAHTMQHWHIYRKWNERFFMECYQAYKDGRAEKNPADRWYEGEIAFYDYYIVPLAKKLKDCGVFGVSSDEYLNYAIKNRQEWEARGREVVTEMLEMAISKETLS